MDKRVSPQTAAVGLLKSIRGHIPRAMLRDRDYARRVVSSLESRHRGRPATPQLIEDLAAIEARLDASARECDRRARSRPRLSYPRELPITSRKDAIVQAIRGHQIVIVSGETGCGKSTQIPKMCLEAGLGVAGLVGCTQPRRIAAVTIAYRIAEELGEDLGRSVGYKIRFQDRTAGDGYIKIMTDGILLAETQGDRRLTDYDTIIIDEAHERSLNIDFLIGIMRRLLEERPDLHLIITSATLDIEKFSQAFRGAPVIEVSGRVYPVEVEYRPPEEEEAEDKDYVDQAVEAVAYLRAEKPSGDILVFMPTEQDILETRRILEGRKYPNTSILPLYSRLPAGQQRMVYTVSGPKIVVATNVAETSLTIPGIRYVVDTGVARIAQYQPGTRIKSLPISPISRASADQRKGRSGRVREGLCLRLYSEAEYDSRDEFTQPEILRSDLAEVILRMIDLGLGDPLEFPFIDRPAARTVRDGYETLVELGAIFKMGTQYSFPNFRGRQAPHGGTGEGRRNSEMSIVSPNSGSAWALTEKGRAMARMPFDPRVSRMLLEAARENCLQEVAVLAAALSIRDPRERPPDQAPQADAVHAAFRHPDSDFLVLLNIWNRYHGDFEKLGSVAQKRKFCHDHFLSFPRMREWVYLHEETRSVLAEQRLGPHPRKGGASSHPQKLPQASLIPHSDVSPALYAAIHRSILAGFLSNIAAHKEKNHFMAAKNREVTLWPGSVLSGKSPAWIVATEVVKTSRLFARQAARIDPAWLEDLGGGLCKRSYYDAAWNRARGEVVAKERVSLFGLEILRDRRVSYGRVNPAEAHEIFVMAGLVEGDLDDQPPFLRHNRALQKKVEAMEEKLRRRDILVSDAQIAKLYSARLPRISDVRSLRKLVKDRGGDEFLRFEEADLVNFLPDFDAVAAFPESVEVAGRPFKAVYRFAPGEEDDGVTLEVPVSLLNAIPPARLEWGVAGQYKDKIAALIKGLPKRYRKLLVPVAEKAETVAAEMPQAPEETPLYKAVAEFVRRRFGADIPAREWALAEVPKYLRMRVAVTDPATGRVIDTGRDIELLRKKIVAADTAPSKIESPVWKEAEKKWEKSGLTGWTFGDLPEKISVGTSLTAYPALVVEDGQAPVGQNEEVKPAYVQKKVDRKDEEGVRSTLFQKEWKKVDLTPSLERGTEAAPSVGIRLFPTRTEAEAAHRQGVRWILLQKFAKELAFVRRYHKIPAESERAALAFGGREVIEKGIEAALARETLERNLRTEAEFKAYEAEVGRTLFEKGHALTQTVVKILDLAQGLRDELAKTGSPKPSRRGQIFISPLSARKEVDRRDSARISPPQKKWQNEDLTPSYSPAYIGQIKGDLEKLLPADFLDLYAIDRIVRIPRQLEAMKIRLSRARIDPEKDKTKAAQVEPYEHELERLEAELRDAGARTSYLGTQYSFPNYGGAPRAGKSEISIVSPNCDLRQAVDELRRMVEEFKISLFAPEIRTAFPISAVRLARKIQEIEAIPFAGFDGHESVKE
jgi:ATP-dependent helicase HrpA